MKNHYDLIRNNQSRGFSIIELMLVVVLASILAATGMAAFGTYLIQSKSSEAMGALEKMAHGEVLYYQRNNAFLDVGPANMPPASSARTVNFAADPNWAEINFSLPSNIYFGYLGTTTSPTTFDCEAYGDLDGDGATSLFQRALTVQADGRINIGGLYTFDELE